MTLDLLEQRRAQLGVPADRMIAVRPLLIRGGLVGLACVGVVALAGVWLSWRQSQLQQQASQLQPAASASEALRQQAEGVGRQAQRLKAANTQLAEALVSVPSSSAWLTALAQEVPAGLQLTSAVSEDRLLKLEGEATDPNGFVRINGLQLGLQQSPLFVPSSIQVQEAKRRDAGQAEPSSSIRFRLEAQFGSRIPLLDGAQLQALQAQGMAYRLAVIEQLGVLP